ncbi:MAG: hypothetical protein ACKVOK_07060, partial [Flavobacteriales bacterium]
MDKYDISEALKFEFDFSTMTATGLKPENYQAKLMDIKQLISELTDAINENTPEQINRECLILFQNYIELIDSIKKY